MILGIFSIIMTLSVPIVFSVIEEQQEKQFFETLQADILFIQNLSIGSNEESRISLNLKENSYSIIKSTHETPTDRFLPKGWTIQTNELPNISFNKKGSIKYKGVLIINTKQNTYTVTFRLGKGRGYIAKR